MSRYSEVKVCPVCGYNGMFLGLKRIVGPEFDSPLGFHAAYVSLYVTCPVCGVQFQNPMPDMTGFYEGPEYRSTVHGTEEQWDENEKQRSEVQVQFIAEQKVSFKTALDVGCSRGFLVDALAEKFGADVEAVEPNVAYVKTQRPVYASLSDVKKKYDLVVCSHVLEHIATPVEFMKQLVAHVNPGGSILVEVPLDGSGEAPYRMVHLIVFNAASLRHVFTKAGVAVTSLGIFPHLAVLGRVAV